MPDTTFLHIRSNDELTTRVLELSGASVRIGRGSQCEIRLREPALAEVQCFLRRRGDSWHVQPVGPSGRLSIEGKAVETSVPLGLGVPLRVCDHWLTIQPETAEVAGLGSFDTPIPVTPVEIGRPEAVEPQPVDDPRTRESTAEADRIRLQRLQADQDQRERSLKRRRDELRWAARWQAAAQSVRSRATPAQPKQPAAHSAPRDTGAAPRDPRPRPTQPSSPPVADPMPAREYRPSVSKYVAPRAQATRPSPPPAARPVEPDRSPVEMLLSRPIESENRQQTPFAKPNRRPLPDEPRSVALPTQTAPRPPDETISTPVESATTTTDESRPAAPLEEFDFSAREREIEGPDARDAGPASTELAVPGDFSSVDSVLEEAAAAALAGPTPQSPDAGEAGCDAVEPAKTSEPTATDRPIVERSQTDVRPSPTKEEQSIPRVFNELLPIESLESVLGTGAAPAEPTRSPGAQPLLDRPPAPAPLPPPHPPGDAGWPSARAIIAAHRGRPAARANRAKPKPQPKAARRPKSPAPSPSPSPTPREARRDSVPSDRREPAAWTLPIWLAWPITAFAALGVGAVGIALAFLWSADDKAAGAVANALLRADKLPDAVSYDADAPSYSWWGSTARHLYLYALAADRSQDPDRLDKIRFYLHAASNASPPRADVKLALARHAKVDAAVERASSSRISQDAISLAWAGREALAAGDVERAIESFQTALSISARAEVRASDVIFDDEQETHRFRLPGEALVRQILEDMAGRGDWEFAQWSKSLPPTAVAWLAAHRVLRERESGDARKALETAASLDPPPAAYSRAEHLAAQGEALALLNRRAEAVQSYRQAIDLAPPSAIRRSWWFNLAEILGRQGEFEERDLAWDRAVEGAPASEEVARQTPLAREKAGLGPKKRGAPRTAQDSARP
jgi:tetratricopeptide (TPR) repeat protein